MTSQIDVILVFEIGQCIKEYHLFDLSYRVVEHSTEPIEQIRDEDGDPAHDIASIIHWMNKVMHSIDKMHVYNIKGINFTASATRLVHLNQEGKPLSPLYGSQKSFPHRLYLDFELRHNRHRLLASETGTPGVGMINAGFQLFWLKYRKPIIYSEIRSTLHLPQFMSYSLTKVPLSDFTCIGCHTAMWHHKRKRLHDWVRSEKIDLKLAPIVPSYHSINILRKTKSITVGVGIHDSTAVLVPYLMSVSKPFVLVSTGASSSSFNPFYHESLTIHDLAQGCLYYMGMNGESILTHRIQLGKEHDQQLKNLTAFFGIPEKKIRKIKYDKDLDKAIRRSAGKVFHFDQLDPGLTATDSLNFENFIQAYHQLMAELVDYQISSMRKVLKGHHPRRIIIEGAFAQHQIFVKMMKKRLKEYDIQRSEIRVGGALGAALAVRPSAWSNKIVKRKLKDV